MTLRVLVVDDEELVRTGVSMIVDSHGDMSVVGVASHGEAAVRESARLSPDVVLMDVRMPGMDGVDATRIIAADDQPTCAVLLLTTYHVDEVVTAALRAGASGVVLKDAAPQELASAIRSVARGEAWLDPAVARRIVDGLRARPEHRLPAADVVAVLTNREREVLRLLAFGLSASEIAEALVISTHTAKTHLSRILMKMGLRDRAQAVAVAYRSGLVDVDDEPPTPGEETW